MSFVANVLNIYKTRANFMPKRGWSYEFNVLHELTFIATVFKALIHQVQRLGHY